MEGNFSLLRSELERLIDRIIGDPWDRARSLLVDCALTILDSLETEGPAHDI